MEAPADAEKDATTVYNMPATVLYVTCSYHRLIEGACIAIDRRALALKFGWKIALKYLEMFREICELTMHHLLLIPQALYNRN